MSTLKHILIVEDVPVIYHEVAGVVEDAGFTVDVFTPSVQDAITRIQKKRPDLVLLDIQLKGDKNGIYLGNLLKPNTVFRLFMSLITMMISPSIKARKQALKLLCLKKHYNYQKTMW